MLILAFETSAKAGSVALLDENKILGESYQNTGLTHSQTLLTMAEDLLKSCGHTPQDVTAVAVAAGPGSFTGVRIGVAAAKGFAWAKELPCCGVSTLEAMALNFGAWDGYICPVMDARRSQCVLEAERNQLPPLPEGRYYICDLVGLAVKTDEGRLLGRLSDVLETGSNQVYEVTEDTTKKKYYLPVIDPVILSTDLEGGLLTVHLLEGLIDE